MISTWMMYNFQDSNSPYSDNLTSFHNLTFMMILIIVSISMYIMFDIIVNSYCNRFLLKNHMVEIMWTIIPMMILMIICFPSLKILYYIDEMMSAYMTVKAVGHQWYWTYEYTEYFFEFDSYMIVNFIDSNFRLLDVDNRMVIPYAHLVRLLTTSYDVIHSWTVPSMGVKMDSIPGRVNQASLYGYRCGLYYGQCSEICGMNHSFMPIVLEVTCIKYFYHWLLENI